MLDPGRARKAATCRAFALPLLILLPVCVGCGDERQPESVPPPIKASRSEPRPEKPPQAEAQVSKGDQGEKSVEKEGGRAASPDAQPVEAGKAAPEARSKGDAGTGGGTATGESDLNAARGLRERAADDEQSGQFASAYSKSLDAWNLARTHAEAPGASGLIAILQVDLARLRNKLNAAGSPPPGKLLRVR
jgi:hypothetical protein